MHLLSGWGSTGEYSAFKLQEAQVLLKDVSDQKKRKRVVYALEAIITRTYFFVLQKVTPPTPLAPNKLAQQNHSFDVNTNQ